MSIYAIELTGIIKKPNGEVDLNYSETVDGESVWDGGVTYSSLAAMDAEVLNYPQRLSGSGLHLALAARARAINVNYTNLASLLGKRLSFDSESVQVVRFQ